MSRFAVVPAAWFDDPRIGVAEVAVLTVLASYADKHGWAYPNQQTMAQQLKKSQGWIADVIRRLVEAGFLEATNISKSGRKYAYRLLADRFLGHYQPADYQPANNDYQPADNSITEPVEQKRTPIAPATGFDEFWAAYPKKVAKPRAERAFAKAIKRTDIKTILAALARYTAATDPQFYANPATWLNDDRWNDQLPTPKPAFQRSSEAALDANTEYWRRKLSEKERT